MTNINGSSTLLKPLMGKGKTSMSSSHLKSRVSAAKFAFQLEELLSFFVGLTWSLILNLNLSSNNLEDDDLDSVLNGIVYHTR